MSDGVKRRLERAGLPYTRENYIRLAGFDVADGEWTAEHEEELPADLQDWSQFSVEPPDKTAPTPAGDNRHED